MKIRTLQIAEIQYLSYRLAKEMMEWDEPIPSFQSRYPNRLESCINQPFQTFGGKNLYPTLVEKSAILFYLMVKNHPFENGNKRIAMATLFLFLFENGKWLLATNQELYRFATSVAKSKPRYRKRTLRTIQKFIKTHIVDRPANL